MPFFAFLSVVHPPSRRYISPLPRQPLLPFPGTPAVSRSKPRAGTTQPQPVGDLLARFLDRSGLAAKVEAASVLSEWAERVGPQIAGVTEALRISEGTLFVAVRTSAWLMELNLIKADLMRYLNAGKTGDGKVRQIVFVMDGGGAGADGAARGVKTAP